MDSIWQHQVVPVTQDGQLERIEGHPSGWQIACSLAGKLAEALLLTALITAAIRFIVQVFYVEGGSMEPTLHKGQHLIINKLSYRWLRPPQRGDLIILQDPHAPSRDYIKRLIGLPSEKVEVRQGQVYINDQPLHEPYIAMPGRYSWGPAIVPIGQYFVLGDNRSKSDDSASWGWLPEKYVIGKVWLSCWPPQYWGMISNGYSTSTSSTAPPSLVENSDGVAVVKEVVV